MGNLGWYQMMTTAAKAVGGPKKLLALLIAGGAVVGTGFTLSVQAIIKKAKSEKNRQREMVKETIYEVIADGKDSGGLEFCAGDKYRILESDGDAILIEKLGDIKNPYFLSGDFLRTISNFTD